MFKKVSDLKKFLDTRFPEGWNEFEPETISQVLEREGVPHTADLNDRVELLISIENNPSLIDDALFFLHAIDVLNGNRATFEYLPHPTSLEVAWAVMELENIFGDAKVLLLHSYAVRHVVTYILRHEGFTNPTRFLKDYIVEGELTGEVDPDKEKAILLYLQGMNDGKSD